MDHSRGETPTPCEYRSRSIARSFGFENGYLREILTAQRIILKSFKGISLCPV